MSYFSNDKCDIKNDLNEEQNKAVESIIKGTDTGAPYLLYGPPGTGNEHSNAC